MNDKVKCGLGISGILAAGAGLGIGVKAGIQKLLKIRKEKKAEKAESSEENK